MNGITLGGEGLLLVGNPGEGTGLENWATLDVKEATLYPVNEIVDGTSRKSGRHREKRSGLATATLVCRTKVDTESAEFLALAAARASGERVGVAFLAGQRTAGTWYYEADWIVRDFSPAQPEGQEQLVDITLEEGYYKGEGVLS